LQLLDSSREGYFVGWRPILRRKLLLLHGEMSLMTLRIISSLFIRILSLKWRKNVPDSGSVVVLLMKCDAMLSLV
jgi:hypothetical protein